MKLHRSSIVETHDLRIAEIVYADADPADPRASSFSIRVVLDKMGHPQIPDLQLAALRRVRTAIDDEIHRLESLQTGSS